MLVGTSHDQHSHWHPVESNIQRDTESDVILEEICSSIIVTATEKVHVLQMNEAMA